LFLGVTEFAREKGFEPALGRELMRYLGIRPAVVSPQKVRMYDRELLEAVFTRLEELKTSLLDEYD
jgi:phosphate starvation-inducible protein PhoH